MKHHGDYGYRGPSGAQALVEPTRPETPMVRLAAELLPHVRSLLELANQLKAHGCTRGQWQHVMARLDIQQTPNGLSWISLTTGMRRHTHIPPEHPHGK